MQFLRIDRVIEEECLYVQYMHIIVKKIRQLLRLPCAAKLGLKLFCDKENHVCFVEKL